MCNPDFSKFTLELCKNNISLLDGLKKKFLTLKYGPKKLKK